MEYYAIGIKKAWFSERFITSVSSADDAFDLIPNKHDYNIKAFYDAVKGYAILDESCIIIYKQENRLKLSHYPQSLNYRVETSRQNVPKLPLSLRIFA